MVKNIKLGVVSIISIGVFILFFGIVIGIFLDFKGLNYPGKEMPLKDYSIVIISGATLISTLYQFYAIREHNKKQMQPHFGGG